MSVDAYRRLERARAELADKINAGGPTPCFHEPILWDYVARMPVAQRRANALKAARLCEGCHAKAECRRVLDAETAPGITATDRRRYGVMAGVILSVGPGSNPTTD